MFERLMTAVCILLCAFIVLSSAAVGSSGNRLQRDDEAGKLVVVVDGREILAYQYGAQYALPHYWPIRSPSGKLLTAQRPNPFPHHRSLWIADNVEASDSPAVDFYHCWKNYRTSGEPADGFRHFIRHQRFGKLKTDAAGALVEAELRWIANETRPVLDEHRTLRVVTLGDGEYLLDLAWELTAAQGDVKFISDSVHYAWPYVRMHPQFSGEQGGTIISDQGHTGQVGTNGKVANWIDYSNKVEGTTEGLAVFIFPDGQPHTWLTREYGTFGPRRAEKLNGTKFTLKSGESVNGRVGILVHRGDVKSGRVAQRYQQYSEGQL